MTVYSVQGVFFYPDHFFEVGQNLEFGSNKQTKMIGGSDTFQSYSNCMESNYLYVPYLLFFVSPKVVKIVMMGLPVQGPTKNGCCSLNFKS